MIIMVKTVIRGCDAIHVDHAADRRGLANRARHPRMMEMMKMMMVMMNPIQTIVVGAMIGRTIGSSTTIDRASGDIIGERSVAIVFEPFQLLIVKVRSSNVAMAQVLLLANVGGLDLGYGPLPLVGILMPTKSLRAMELPGAEEAREDPGDRGQLRIAATTIIGMMMMMIDDRIARARWMISIRRRIGNHVTGIERVRGCHCAKLARGGALSVKGRLNLIEARR